MEDPRKFREVLYDPLPGTTPDAVPEEVIQDEMAAFLQLNVETQRG